MGYIEVMGSYIRRLWICLLVLALPVQGMAAVTMAFCGQSGQAGAAVFAVPAVFTGFAHDMHGQHGMHHSMHRSTEAAQSMDLSLSDDAMVHTAQPDSHQAGHSCSACATCCAATFIPAAGVLMVAIDTTAKLPTGVLVDIGPFATDAPDRPPRPLLA